MAANLKDVGTGAGTGFATGGYVGAIVGGVAGLLKSDSSQSRSLDLAPASQLGALPGIEAWAAQQAGGGVAGGAGAGGAAQGLGINPMFIRGAGA